VDPTARRQALAERLQRRGLAQWVLVPGANLTYLTGLCLEPTERLFLFVHLADGSERAVCPALEAERVSQVLGSVRLYPYRDETGPGAALARALAALGTRAVDVAADFGSMRLFERAAVEDVIPRARWHDLRPDAMALRQVKDPDEIDAIAAAAGIAARAVAAGLAVARPGVGESAVRAACEQELLSADSFSPFRVMVASGPRTADPHAGPQARELQAGDACWIDLGATVRGYCADITRTVVLAGPGDAEARAALEAVVAAQRAAVAAVRPGVTAASIDAVARGALAAVGLAAHFTHRTGHGLGLEVHEQPAIVDGNEEPLRPRMVFTVEPGVYLPGRFGVRVEDDVVVTDGGCRVLTGDAPAGAQG
jgi:Xaa-Pro dipeptidase